jgi:alpha-L-rhamnosidase
VRTTAGRDLGIGERAPSLGWSGGDGSPWRVEVEGRPAVEGTGYPTWVAWPGEPLQDRERVTWTVSVGDQTATGTLEAGLTDWTADYLAVTGDDGVESPRLATTFELGPFTSARLYVTALGLHDTSINGRPVSEDVLAPGSSAYQHRLAYDTYDVTALLREGSNELASVLGDGWYRGNLNWAEQMHRCHYGDRLALRAQLEVTTPDGVVTIATGPDGWTATTTAVRSADIYMGTVTDLTHVPRPLGTEVLSGPQQLVVRQGPPIRRTEVRTSDPRAGLHDFGQNLAGWVRLTVRARHGQTVTLRHAEVLQDGELALAPLRLAKATDTWVLSEGEHVLEPSFTFHGFRYADVSTEAEVLAVEAVAVHSDLVRTGQFACSDERITKLHENVVWGQRSNFLSVPTDCPQRDERLGWTGDAQVFASTAALLHDCRGFFADWLGDLRAEQLPDGNVPVVVPNTLPEGYAGMGGWSDAAVVIPWQVAVRSGDTSVLAASADSMRGWVDFVAGQLTDGLWISGFQLGDWLDPDAPPGEAWAAKADGNMVCNAVLAQSADLLARGLDLLGQPSETYHELASSIREKAWERWGSEAVTTQTGCALFLRFGVVPVAEQARFAQALADLVDQNGGRVGTGFLGTPEVLFALSDHGQVDAAYQLLTCDACPSWLYQVDRGATTMWERWDAIRPDGSLNLGGSEANEAGMLSFNHYAYGAVAAWLHEVVAGLSVRELPEPEIVIAPRKGGGLTWAEASLETPRGTASVRWDAAGITATIPPGYTAWLDVDGTRTALPAGTTTR